jgi:2-hydroxychromene-2-carboxylate isomerase
MPAPIDFWFDFGSPYAYLASLRIEQVAARGGRTVRWRPMLLGAVFKTTGAVPLMRKPLHGDYMRHDVPRFARMIGAPFVWPDSAPIGAVAACRAFYWLEGCHPEQAKRFAQAVFHAHWALGHDMAPVEAVAAVAVGAGVDPAALTEAVGRPEIKDRLRAVNEEAQAAGVFGSPFIVVDGEPFWGADRLDQVARWLETGGW